MSDRRENGCLEAHTPAPDAGAQPADGADRPGETAQAPAAELPGTDPDQLLAGLPEEAAVDVLELVAETALAPRRARGRPAGAGNRKNAELIAYLAARGHRDPWVTLSLIQSADFRALCTLVGADTAKSRLQVLKIQQSAAEAIMPYHHSRKPQQLELPAGDRRPLLAIGELNLNLVSQDGTMSAGIPVPQPEQNQQLIEAEAVRERDASGEPPASD